ncbi:MAG: ATP-binding protein [Armatimonas sp.]
MTRRSTHLTIAFGVLLALLVGNAIFANRAIQGMVDSQQLVEHTLKVQLGLQQCQSEFERSMSEVRAYFNTSDSSFLANWTNSRRALWQEISKLKEITSDNHVQTEHLEKLEKAIKAQDAFIQESLETKHRDFADKPWVFKKSNLEKSKAFIAEINQQIRGMENEEKMLSADRESKSERAERDARITIFGATVMACLTLLSTFLLIRQMFREREISEDQIRQANAELEQRVQDRTRSLQLANEGLHTANKELEAFSYTVSHDLRAPVRHVLGFAELLEKRSGELLNDSGKRYLMLIKEAGQRAGALIDDLLAFSRMSRTQLDFRNIDMNDKVAKVQANTVDAYPDKTIQWTIEPLPEVHGDPAMLRLVWQNLLDNAVKYSSNNDVIQVRVGADREGDDWVFFVKDNGVGFDMEHAQNLFGVFQRLHEDESFEGTGIGLANVRRIVARHGGRTWAESAPGQGATFYFSLPATPPESETRGSA